MYERLLVPGPMKYKINYKSVERSVAIPTFHKRNKQREQKEFKKTNDPNPFSY